MTVSGTWLPNSLKRGKPVVKEADGVKEAEAEKEAGGEAQAQKEKGAADRLGLRGGIHHADVFLVERAVDIDLLDDAQEFLV